MNPDRWTEYLNVCNNLHEYIDKCSSCGGLIENNLTYQCGYPSCYNCGFDFGQFYVEVEPVVDISVRSLCCRAYPLHSKGCPNIGKKKDCPPFAPLVTDVLDFNKSIYAIYNIFNYKSHVEKMREKHPKWSDRQVKCVLYWQPKARKQLKEKIKYFSEYFPEYYIVKNPEAQGVNLTKTMKNIGIELEWPPENIAYQIVLAGMKLI